MYELFIANKNYSSWSLRPWVLMKALGHSVRGAAHSVSRQPARANFEAFKKFSPSGKVPCLKDGETVVWDSLAIAEYLAERHPGVWPTDAAGAGLGALGRGGDAFGLRSAPQHLRHELRHPGEDEERAGGRHAGSRAARRALERRAEEVRRAVSGRQGFYQRRCVLLPGGVSRADLWAEGRRDFGSCICSGCWRCRRCRSGTRRGWRRRRGSSDMRMMRGRRGK